MGKVLLTGASGGVARLVRPLLRARYGELVLTSRSEPDALDAAETWRPASLTDTAALTEALQDVDRVIHLGGQSREAEWETVDASNIEGLRCLYEAARRAGVRRIVFASSVHAVGFYPMTRRIGTADPVRPDTLYGISKAFGEALSSYYADKFGLRILSVRIGSLTEVPQDRERLPIWLHPEDFVQLCAIGLEHPDIHNQVVFGASANTHGLWDNGEAFRLGYRPQHSAEAAVDADTLPPAEGLTGLFHGGSFAAEDYAGDLERSLWPK